jgi:ABC-type siderophore export system fused ATPase/permease subunit
MAADLLVITYYRWTSAGLSMCEMCSLEQRVLLVVLLQTVWNETNAIESFVKKIFFLKTVMQKSIVKLPKISND